MAPHFLSTFLVLGSYKLSTEQSLRYLSCTLSSERHRLSGNPSILVREVLGMKMTAFHVVKDLQILDFHIAVRRMMSSPPELHYAYYLGSVTVATASAVSLFSLALSYVSSYIDCHEKWLTNHEEVICVDD